MPGFASVVTPSCRWYREKCVTPAVKWNRAASTAGFFATLHWRYESRRQGGGGVNGTVTGVVGRFFSYEPGVNEKKHVEIFALLRCVGMGLMRC